MVAYRFGGRHARKGLFWMAALFSRSERPSASVCTGAASTRPTSRLFSSKLSTRSWSSHTTYRNAFSRTTPSTPSVSSVGRCQRMCIAGPSGGRLPRRVHWSLSSVLELGETYLPHRPFNGTPKTQTWTRLRSAPVIDADSVGCFWEASQRRSFARLRVRRTVKPFGESLVPENGEGSARLVCGR